MSTGKVYKQAIKRVFAEKYHDERMAVYWGLDDETIHVIASLRHYVHKICSGSKTASSGESRESFRRHQVKTTQ
jgi:uncharacterized damage-inducible protein DinB